MAQPLSHPEVFPAKNAPNTPEGTFVERRKRPRIATVPRTPPPPPSLADYESIVDRADLDEIRWIAHQLRGKRLKLINATALGGTIADALSRIVPLLKELEIHAQWDVVTGGNDFYHVNKAFLGALQGGEYHFSPEALDVYTSYVEHRTKPPAARLRQRHHNRT
jgi:hypothetical protein